MLSNSELLDQLESDIGKEVNDDNVNRDKVKTLVKTIIIVEGVKRYVFSYKAITKKANISVVEKITKSTVKHSIKEETLLREANKTLIKRSKLVKYNKLAKRQSFLFQKQLKKEGLAIANRKLKIRMGNIFKSELGHLADAGKMGGAKVVNKLTNKVVTKRWVHNMYGTARDGRPSHISANGQTVLIDDMFFVSGMKVNAPREFGIASEDINCHCGIDIVLL
jgi:hypothetical protein